MSTDWAKYASAADCRMRAVRPANNGVVQLAVEGVRACPPLSVQHTPRSGHRSHTDVTGVPLERTPIQNKVRLHLFKVAEHVGWVIEPDAPLDSMGRE